MTSLDKTELKNLALREKIGQIVSNYEDQIAELRAELTIYARTNEELSLKLNDLEESINVQKESEGNTDLTESADEAD